jgi:hypothetical protein
VTIDEELALLAEQLRRLKIEYDMFFNNPSKRPPNDVEWKVLSLIRKFSDGTRMSFSQRFKYNELAQRYAIQSDLWRKKTRIREEGCRRPQDALLSVQGVGFVEGRAPKRQVYGLAHPTHPVASDTTPHPEPTAGQPFSVECSGAPDEHKQVESLYHALTGAKQKSGEKVSGNLDSFAAFVKKKTSELRKKHACEKVEYSVEIQSGQVKLKAKAKV